MIDISDKFFSVFYEGPGAIRWRRKKNEKIYSYLPEEYGYTSRRPDIMIYSGKIDNIYDPNEKPFPIRKNPFMIIECKEKADWYKERKKNGEKEIDVVKKYKEIYNPKKIFSCKLEENTRKSL